jgi:hypothetical protein
MDLYVVKIKDKNLFFNADEISGEYISPLPLIVDKKTADRIMLYCPEEIYTNPLDIEYFKMPKDLTTFKREELEIKKIKLVYE